MNDIATILNRGVEEIIPRDEFISNLKKNNNLRLKMGFDPSAPDIHLGHAVGLRKLRQLQDLGHTVVLIVADWTAQIGDPSGRSETRPMLTYEEVKYNAETYLKQFFKIVNKSKTEIRWQSEWYGKFKLENIIHMTDKGSSIDKSVIDYINEQFDPSMNWKDAEYCVKKWGGPFALKGVMSVEDAKRAIDIGCTAIMISNHGGRQLDGSISPFDALKDIVDAVGGKIEIILDILILPA